MLLQLSKQLIFSCFRYLPEAGIFFFLLFPLNIFGQNTAGKSFEFINIPASARQMGLGGKNISSADRDPNMFLSNPSTLTKEGENLISFNYILYPSKINYLNSTYTKNFKGLGNWGVGINYLNYGSFDGYDPSGEPTGSFSSSEYAVIIGNAHKQGNFSLGGNIKLAGSNLGWYYSSALLLDIGGMFTHPIHDFQIGMVFKNGGFIFKKYYPSSKASLPFDVQLGASLKPKFMPVRISVTLHHLYRFKTNQNTLNSADKINVADQILRHMVFGAELLISKSVQIRAGYDYLRHKELKVEQKRGASGFSFGAMVRIKTFEVAYSRGIFIAGGAQNCFTIIANMNTFLKNNN